MNDATFEMDEGSGNAIKDLRETWIDDGGDDGDCGSDDRSEGDVHRDHMAPGPGLCMERCICGDIHYLINAMSEGRGIINRQS